MRLAGALLFVTSTALAEPAVGPGQPGGGDASFSFEWNAPTPCPARSEVLLRAEQLIGHRVARASGARAIELLATVQQVSESIWQLSVWSGPGNGSNRSVTASSCNELADAMALLIALSIDPDYATRNAAARAPDAHATFSDVPSDLRQPPTPPPEPGPRPVVEPSGPAHGKVEPARQRSAPPLHLAVGALGAVWAGRLPGVAPGGVLRGSATLGDIAVGLEVAFFPEEHVVKPGGAADLWLGSLGGSLGYALFDGLLTPAVGVELDRVHGRGSGVANQASGAIWLLGLDAGLLFRYPLTRSVRLLLGGRISGLAERARFHIDPNVELFASDRVGAQFGLGAEVRLQ